MNKPVVCIGAAMVDQSFRCWNEPVPGTSNPSTHTRTAGGVARNVAHNLAQLGHDVELITHFGNDSDGEWLKQQCINAGVGVSHSHCTSAGTGHFTAILSPGGDLHIGASATMIEQEITVEFLVQHTDLLVTASLMVLDCNLNVECIGWLVEWCRSHSVPCVIEPVSVAKASALREINLCDVLLITPNEAELAVLSPASSVNQLLERGIRNIWIRKGSEGSEFYFRGEVHRLPAPKTRIVDTTGAGDAALAGWVYAWLHKKNSRECVTYGHAMAEIILSTRGANAPHLTKTLLEQTVAN